MSKEIEMKLKLLDELKHLMMGDAGSKFKPKGEMHVEVMELGKPKAEEEDEMHEEPLEPVDMEDMDHDDGDEDCEMDEDGEPVKKKKTLREFLESL